MNQANRPWTPMGSTGQYADMTGIIEPDNPFDNLLKGAQVDSLKLNDALKQKKFDMLSGFLRGFGNGSAGGTMSMTPLHNIPGPRYLNAGPVWSQSQIDAQSNQQRGNLLTQAATASRGFGADLASRGFSPNSPFAMFNQQNNLMKANAGAATNETGINWTAAKANSDAKLGAEGINAGIYGDYIKSLASQNSIQADLWSRQQAQQMEMLRAILGGLA